MSIAEDESADTTAATGGTSAIQRGTTDRTRGKYDTNTVLSLPVPSASRGSMSLHLAVF